MAIRRSLPGEESAIRKVNEDAFRDDASSQKTEHLVVDKLREDGALTVSLVADVNRSVGGHIAVSPVTIGEASSGWYLLGPVAVAPELQQTDNDDLLFLAGVNTMQFARRAAGCVVVGDSPVYRRYGFAPCDGVTLAGAPDKTILCKAMNTDKVPAGEVKLHPAFAVKA